MLKIHHLNQSRSERVVWLAEELGIDYELVKHQRDPQTFRSPPSLHALGPLGKAPVIEDNGKTIFESGAVIEYLVDHYGQGRLRPAAGTPEFLRYQYWMHCAESTLATPVAVDFITRIMGQVKNATIDGFVQGEYKAILSYLNEQLGAGGYVAGPQFTAADPMVAYPLWLIDGTILKESGFAQPSLLADYPNIVGYLARLKQRPAHLRALVKMGD
jgi:glutathione S-transferase